MPIGDLDARSQRRFRRRDHALSRDRPHRDKLRPNAVAVVIGVGGLGHMAVAMLRALSAVRIVAIDRREEALAVARTPAPTQFAAAELTIDGLRAEVGGAGATLVLDFVATDETLGLAIGAVGMGGAVVYVGRGGGTLPVTPSPCRSSPR